MNLHFCHQLSSQVLRLQCSYRGKSYTRYVLEQEPLICVDPASPGGHDVLAVIVVVSVPIRTGQDSPACVRTSTGTSVSTPSFLAWLLQGRQALCSAPSPSLRHILLLLCWLLFLPKFSTNKDLREESQGEQHRLPTLDTAILLAIQRGTIRFYFSWEI